MGRCARSSQSSVAGAEPPGKEGLLSFEWIDSFRQGLCPSNPHPLGAAPSGSPSKENNAGLICHRDLYLLADPCHQLTRTTAKFRVPEASGRVGKWEFALPNTILHVLLPNMKISKAFFSIIKHNIQILQICKV